MIAKGIKLIEETIRDFSAQMLFEGYDVVKIRLIVTRCVLDLMDDIEYELKMALEVSNENL